MFDKTLFALPGIKRILGILGLLAIVQAACIIGQAYTLAWAITNLWHGEALALQTPWVAGFLGCFVARQTCSTIQDDVLARYAQRQAIELRERLLGHALGGAAGWVRGAGTARVTTATLEGVDQVENYLKVILPKTIGAGVILPTTLVASFLLDWPSGIILLVVLPVIVFYMIMLGRLAQDRAARQYGAYQRLSSHFLDTLRGLGTLKVFGAAKRHAAEVFEVSEQFREATMKTLRVATLSSVALDLFATLGVAAVAMLLGFRLVVGTLDLFTAMAVLMLAPEYFAPLRQFAGNFHASLDGRNALKDILGLVGDDAPEGEDPAIGTWGPDSTLTFENVAFSHASDSERSDENPTLADISFSITGLKRVGIVGASGSGKSTLANLLGGFNQPQSGTISIDGIAQPLGSLSSRSWQRQVLFIPQDPHLFHASLRDNITFYTPGASDEEIAEAVHVVGLDALVDELPHGLDTIIGEGGRALSGGQAHRIALARALLDRERRILIFDEPTAHLDLETELELKERMLPLMHDRLVFFATHRLHWLDSMDYVLVLEDGRIADQFALENKAQDASPAPIVEEFAKPDAACEREPESAPAAHAHDDTWVRPYFGKYRPQLTKALGLGVAAAAFAALLMFTAGYLISATAEATGSILLYYLPIAFVQVFGLGKPVLRYFERLQSHDWVFRMTSSLRVRLYKALETQALKPGGRSIGEVLGVVSEDVGHIQNLYLRTVFPVVIAWSVLLLAVVGTGLFDPVFALVFLLGLCVVAVAMPVAAVRLNRTPMAQVKDAKNTLYETLTDDMLGASDWVFSGRGAACVEARMGAVRKLDALQARVDRYVRIDELVRTILLGALACLVLAWAAMRFAPGDPNWIAAFILGFFPLVEVCTPLSPAVMQMNVHRDSIDRLNSFPDTDDAVDVPEHAGIAVLSHDIHIRGLEFAYEGGTRQVLDGISLTIPHGQHLAVLGCSGSGKSTLAALLRGDAHPSAGFATIGGRPTTAFGDDTARHIGVVQQNGYLFDRSVRENLVLGKPDATDEEIWHALEQAQLANLVRELPEGLDTPADEAGMRFSGGERQRLALARVLLADTPIILLDEPTVGLDPATEQAVLDALFAAAADKTLVMITHHLQGIEAFDRVVFLENGHIELDGSPAELAATSERYRALLSFDRA